MRKSAEILIRNWRENFPGNTANLPAEMIFKIAGGNPASAKIEWMFSGMPKTDPVITGLKSMYSVGEFVHANCTSAESYPVAALRWYINDNQIEPWQLQRYAVEEGDEREVRPSTLGISFQADYNHFPGKGLTMHLRCVAQVEDVIRQTSYAAKLAELDLDKYAQGLLRNSGNI
ncbi:UNVERIFIED_CONTAM: hypothetical protein PYX00_007618 [Menopon gallinae]|uniref:CD80-like immunoglobulin C2-set domain-containing protein n=1 Tax=Menopon gallinae TaxID=328185 RepID=A0AAW2HKZ7_9NEOP